MWQREYRVICFIDFYKLCFQVLGLPVYILAKSSFQWSFYQFNTAEFSKKNLPQLELRVHCSYIPQIVQEIHYLQNIPFKIVV